VWDGFIPGIGSDPELMKKCFAYSERKATTTQPSHIFVHEQKDRQRWIVAQWMEIIPPNQDEYDENRAAARDYLLMEAQQQMLTRWFEPEQIRARVDWIDAPTPKTEETEEATADKDESTDQTIESTKDSRGSTGEKKES